jgi:hypothetical protein
VTAQQGIVYRYFRVDADHDVSTDTLELGLSETAWSSTGVVYVAPDDYPPSVLAANAAKPSPTGFTGYWWRAMTGPAQTLPLQRGRNRVFGRLTDTPEAPHFSWMVSIPNDA